MKTCFLFNAQRHQLLHGLATAVALSRRAGHEVFVVSPSAAHIAYAERLAERLGGGGQLHFVAANSRMLAAARRKTGRTVPPKLLTLAVLAPWLDTFDAIAIPERTSLILKQFGVRRPRFIHLDHGAGDRAVGFDRRIARFDFVLMAGEKHRRRLLADRLIRAGAHAVVGYPKFDAADAMRDAEWTPFAEARPIVLYNPHFASLGSWERMGGAVLAAFAAQDRYNLIVAPHVRLLDGARARARWSDLLDRYDALPHIHIDRGSDRAIDMTLTARADIYLGDVSSQVYEFLRTPKPCLFLDAHGIAWDGDDNYAHWAFGPVLRTTDGLIAAVDRAVTDHPRLRAVQEAGFARSFAPGGAAQAAGAIAGYLDRLSPSVPRPIAPRRSGLSPGLALLRRAAAFVPLLAAGWLMHEAIDPVAGSAEAAPFIDRVVASHRTTLMRERMASQPEITIYDPVEIARATGVAMPILPAGWRVRDVQVFPSIYGPLVQVMADVEGMGRMSLVAIRMETPAEAKPLMDGKDGDHVAYWEEGDCAYALVGGQPAARLLALAAKLAG